MPTAHFSHPATLADGCVAWIYVGSGQEQDAFSCDIFTAFSELECGIEFC